MSGRERSTGSAVQVKIFEPCAPLAPFVRSFEIVETGAEATRTLLPVSGAVMGFRYRGASALVEHPALRPVPAQVFTNVRCSTQRMRTSPGSGIVLVKFRETGAAMFFDVPMHELPGAPLALDALLPHAEIDSVSSQVTSAPDHLARIRAVESFLLARLRKVARDPAVEAAVRWIHAAHGSLAVRTLADRSGLGIDTLEKRFRRIVGIAPKRLASLVRLRHAMELARTTPNMAALALDAGYYDQAHFIRAFRGATGTTPGRFFDTVDHC